jgi:hypothetical protein
MRFSLKWILAGMTYAAVAAAALTQDTRVYADILWAATLVTFAFAVVAACFARGPRQIAAASFVVFSGCYLLCLHFAAESVPTASLLLAWRYEDLANAPPPPGLIVPGRANAYTGAAGYGLSDKVAIEARARAMQFELRALQQAARLQAQVVSSANRRSNLVDLSAYLRAGNALATMSFGLLGCLLAPLAFKAAKPSTVPPPPPTAANALDPVG